METPRRTRPGEATRTLPDQLAARRRSQRRRALPEHRRDDSKTAPSRERGAGQPFVSESAVERVRSEERGRKFRTCLE
jgi:hypothetical protein